MKDCPKVKEVRRFTLSAISTAITQLQTEMGYVGFDDEPSDEVREERIHHYHQKVRLLNQLELVRDFASEKLRISDD